MELSNPAHITTDQLRAAFTTGELTPSKLLQSTLDRIATVDASLGAIAFLNADQATEQADAATRRWTEGRPLSLLDGIPITIKDSVNAIGTPWRHGTAPNSQLPMATVDAPPAARLKEAGAVIVAKTAMPDFGMLAAGVSSLYGIVRNPWNLSMNTGGSSAGAGASLAAGIGWGSVGSDIAGSVRLPAAHCGLVALKPTQGQIPHLAPSTVRSAGPMARTVREAAELLQIVSAPDSRDLLSLPLGPVDPDQCGHRDLDVAGLRIGLLLDYGYGFGVHADTAAIVTAAVQQLDDAGATVVELPAVFDHDAYAALDRLFQVRALAEWQGLGDSRDQVLAEVAAWCQSAQSIDAAQHERDLATVLHSAGRVQELTATVDIVISAVIPGTGFRADMVGLDAAAPLSHCSFTCWYNQTGQPAATVPFGFSQGMPIGVQVVGQRFADATVMQVASWLEDRRTVELDWPTAPRDTAAVDESYFAHNYKGN